MGVQFANNAYSTLAGSINSSVTSISVAASTGSRFPSASVGAGTFFFLTIINTANQYEIVKVTNRSGDTLTVSRGQDGTTARAFTTGDRLELRPTAAALGSLPNRKLAVDDYDDSSVTPAKLAAVGISAGTYGGNGLTPRLTVNSKGQVTGVTEDTAVVDQQIFNGTAGGTTTTPFTWTKPTKGTYVRLQMWGGGAGGSRQAANGTQAHGGGGGGYLEKIMLLSDLGSSSYSGTVANGGIGKTAANGDGTSGGTTTFMGVTVGGGEARLAYQQGYNWGGGNMNLVALGGAPFTTLPGGQQDGYSNPYNGGWLAYIYLTATFSGGAGMRKDTTKYQMVGGYSVADGNGQNSIYGGGGGGGKPVAAGAASAGGQSMHGGNGGSSSAFDSGNGGNGLAPGGGGGAGFNAGGDGAGGRVVLTVW
jgi:hypothetical protein